MAHPTYKDGGGLVRSVKASGSSAGTNADPDVLYRIIEQIPDGADVVAGLTTDTAVVGNNPGTISAKLRGLNWFLSTALPAALGRLVSGASISVTFSSSGESVALTDAAGVKGSFKAAGPHFAPSPIILDNVAAAGTVDLTAAPGTGLKIAIDDLTISVDTTCRVTLIEEGSLVVRGSWFLLANTPFSMCAIRDGIRCVVADMKMRIKTSVAANLSATGGYHSE